MDGNVARPQKTAYPRNNHNGWGHLGLLLPYDGIPTGMSNGLPRIGRHRRPGNASGPGRLLSRIGQRLSVDDARYLTGWSLVALALILIGAAAGPMIGPLLPPPEAPADPAADWRRMIAARYVPQTAADDVTLVVDHGGMPSSESADARLAAAEADIASTALVTRAVATRGQGAEHGDAGTRALPVALPVALPAALPNASDVPFRNMPYGGRPQIAIVIDDLGMSPGRTASIARLPATLTLAFLPHAGNLDRQVAAARREGHEVIAHVPMEPLDGRLRPGPQPLHTGLNAPEIERRLARDLSRLPGPVGINNHMGSRFTSDPNRLAVVLSALRERGLYFLDSLTSPRSEGARMARRMGVPYAVRDVFLDDTISHGEVWYRLRQAEAIARRKGHAIAIGHPHQATLDVLRQWLPQAQARGVELVPVSALLNRPMIAMRQN